MTVTAWQSLAGCFKLPLIRSPRVSPCRPTGVEFSGGRAVLFLLHCPVSVAHQGADFGHLPGLCYQLLQAPRFLLSREPPVPAASHRVKIQASACVYKLRVQETEPWLSPKETWETLQPPAHLPPQRPAVKLAMQNCWWL